MRPKSLLRAAVLLPAGLLAVGTAAAQTEVPSTPPSSRMAFEALDTAGICEDCLVVQAKGEIDEATSRDFWAFLARTKTRKTVVVVLHSPGGTMLAASSVGEAIRKLGAATVVGVAVRKKDSIEIAPGSCLSACFMTSVGGTQRAVPPGSEIGVHAWMPGFLVEPKTPEDRKPRPFDRTAVRAMHLSSAAHMGHLDRMGVDLRVMIRLLQTPFERMRRLTAQELKDYRVTTSDELTRAEPGRHRQVLALPRSAPAAKPPAEPAGEALRRASG